MSSKWVGLIVAAIAVASFVTTQHLLAADSTTAPTTSTSEAGPNKFYGTISAVDPAAKTFTVDNQTYNIIGESQMTKAEDGSAATLADATVGEPARGSYTKSADGKLNVTKVRFGKKTGGKSGGGNGGKSGGKKNKDATTQPAAQ